MTRLLRRRVFYKTCTVGDCIRNAPLLYIYGKSGTKVPLFFDYKKLVEANALGHHSVSSGGLCKSTIPPLENTNPASSLAIFSQLTRQFSADK